MTPITDTLCCLLFAAGVAVLVAGCIEQPTFCDRCHNCGEYLETAEASHRHFKESPSCR
jgi:hypothetical protein